MTETSARDDVTASEQDPRPTQGPEAQPGDGHGYHLEIFAICFASLLLGSAYTRVGSFKLFYY
mgnify:CR=1 FL=1